MEQFAFANCETKCKDCELSIIQDNKQNLYICHSEGEARKNLANIKSAGLPRSLSFARNDAFTLAEVLITLVIIGVIAAITVPTLITKYQKEQTVTRLKKVYSTLAQTTAKAVADNGPIKNWTLIDHQSKEFAEQYILPYLSVMKNCEYSTSNECSFKFKNRLNGEKVEVELDSNIFRFILNDGTSVAIFTRNYRDSQLYCYVIVDINGNKKPNISGKDVFVFIYWIYSSSIRGKLIPVDLTSTREVLKNNCQNGNGTNWPWYPNKSCAALIMKDGWQIKDDYPW